jgi:hypothetical protein
MGKLVRSLRYGIRRRWLVGLRSVFVVLGLIWLVTEVASFLFPNLETWFQLHRLDVLIVLALVSVIAFLISIYEPWQVSFDIPTTRTHLTIKYGDVFQEKADLIVAVNEFFDGALGQVVASPSVHGQFISLYFSSDADAFRSVVDPLLSSYQSDQVTRSIAPNLSYPIGTTIKVPCGQFNAFLVALTKTDLQTHKATTTVAYLWIALTNALESIHHLNNGQPVAIPLIGNGLSGLILQPQHILRLLTLSIVETARKMQLPDSITIVLHEDCFDKLDLREIAKNWRQ